MTQQSIFAPIVPLSQTGAPRAALVAFGARFNATPGEILRRNPGRIWIATQGQGNVKITDSDNKNRHDAQANDLVSKFRPKNKNSLRLDTQTEGNIVVYPINAHHFAEDKTAQIDAGGSYFLSAHLIAGFCRHKLTIPDHMKIYASSDVDRSGQVPSLGKDLSMYAAYAQKLRVIRKDMAADSHLHYLLFLPEYDEDFAKEKHPDFLVALKEMKTFFTGGDDQTLFFVSSVKEAWDHIEYCLDRLAPPEPASPEEPSSQYRVPEDTTDKEARKNAQALLERRLNRDVGRPLEFGRARIAGAVVVMVCVFGALFFWPDALADLWSREPTFDPTPETIPVSESTFERYEKMSLEVGIDLPADVADMVAIARAREHKAVREEDFKDALAALHGPWIVVSKFQLKVERNVCDRVGFTIASRLEPVDFETAFAAWRVARAGMLTCANLLVEQIR